MNVLLFGATGMVGQGVLRECLLDPGVQMVQTVGRSATGAQNPKLRGVVHQDLWHYDAIAAQLTEFDSCFFCLGVSSSGMPEADYERVTFGITMAAAEILCRLNPRMTFVYVSGAGTDSSERGRSMWARIKGKTENALQRLPFAAAYMFRPGIIEPLYGVKPNSSLSSVLFTCQTAAADASADLSESSFDDRTGWSRHVSHSEERLPSTSSGEQRYSSCRWRAILTPSGRKIRGPCCGGSETR
jgi:uncharacterized protein YbjT (DUF2867 family)